MQSNQSHRHSAFFRATLKLQFGSILFIFFILYFSFPTHAQTHLESISAPSSTISSQCVPSITQYAIAKNKKIGQTNTPDTTWLPIQQLPYYWNTLWQPFESNAWYQIQLDYHCPHAQQFPISLMIENLNIAGEILINDEVFWQSNAVDIPHSRHLHHPMRFSIPASIFKQGQNTLLIHVYGSATQKSGLGKVSLGDSASINQKFNSLHLEKRVLPTFTLAINIIVSLFCFMVWAFNRKESSFLWFSLASLAWASYSCLILTIEPLRLFSDLFFDQLTIFIFCCYVCIACLCIWYFAGQSYPKIEKALLIFLIVAALCIFGFPVSLQPKVHLVFFCIAMVIFLLKAISYPWVVYKTKYREAYWILFSQMVYIPLSINDALYIITNKGHILSPYAAPFNSIFVGLILSLRLARINKRISIFNKTLELSVTNAKQELEKSLTNQHHLAIENIKLQQRIQLSHDLHDGLGGSIVRSMALLDNNHVDQKQMQSILKLLRSDLRQIIDSGSSLGDKSPDTPILWIAPLRHRFIQVFEDLDIESTWNMPEHWLIVPPPLYCITLSRIAEEALTNIIKHSQATQVTVKFEQDWQHNLILTIQDNGVGFDAEHVQPNLHVGLHSMQMRIQRLGGLLKIQSEDHYTQISAQLNTQRILDNGENV